MAKEGKNIGKARAQVEKRPYALQDAVPLLQKIKFAKFDETVDLTLRLGVDPRHADQMVRGTVVLPHGLARPRRSPSSLPATSSAKPKPPEPTSSVATSSSRKFRRNPGPTSTPSSLRPT